MCSHILNSNVLKLLCLKDFVSPALLIEKIMSISITVPFLISCHCYFSYPLASCTKVENLIMNHGLPMGGYDQTGSPVIGFKPQILAR